MNSAVQRGTVLNQRTKLRHRARSIRHLPGRGGNVGRSPPTTRKSVTGLSGGQVFHSTLGELDNVVEARDGVPPPPRVRLYPQESL